MTLRARTRRHTARIETHRVFGSLGGFRHRATCPCGWSGPWRRSRRRAERDIDGHGRLDA